MMLVHPTSLSATLDATADAFFNQLPISTTQRQEIATLIISRQYLTGSNAGSFLPFAAESEKLPRLFCGDQLKTNFARDHILLIESARILVLLEVDNHGVAKSIQTASHLMERMCYSRFCDKGECKILTIAYLRSLAAGGPSGNGAQLNSNLARLSAARDGKGSWKGFPFFFTLLMLLEVDDPLALQELQYSAQACTKLRSQNWAADPYSTRRQAILDKVLSRN